VLALRVVQPGLLGVPRRLLFPVAGDVASFRSGLPFLKLLLPDLTHIHLLHVERVSAMRMRLLTHEQSVHLRRPGVGLCVEVERELTVALGDSEVMVDTHVVVSNDVAQEILIHAGKLNSRLIYTAASERSPARSFVAGNPLEQLLRDAPCDVAVYRGLP
jgi:nucleotide-binding universal stress UspA family protein